jgi:uncharacterized repeat protein (TIGR02543 family)
MRNKMSCKQFIVMIAAVVSFAVTDTLVAQAPAGPRRPSSVPSGYVITPSGYFHSSCVLHLAKGEMLVADGRVLQRADGTLEEIPVCKYPRYTARGEMIAPTLRPPSISHSWIEDFSVTTGTSFGEVTATWPVPSAPTSSDGQIVYFFPGLEDVNDIVSIIQPVLGWNADFSGAWGIASWNCCVSGTTQESSPVRVNLGDTIQGTVKSTCSAGTLSCSTWNITTDDVSSGGSTTLSNSPNEGQTFNWAFAGVLEVYNIVQCSDYPPNGEITFNAALYDDEFNQLSNPGWSFTNLASGLTPQCSYGGQGASKQVTLDFFTNPETLAVSVSGGGSVASSPPGIVCPGACSSPFQSGTVVLLTATSSSGYVFEGWSGACSGKALTCQISMTAARNVTATFSVGAWWEAVQYLLVH